VVEAMSKAIMNCQGNSMVNQKFILSGSYNVLKSFKMVQNFKLSSTCTNNAQNMADIKNAVTNAIEQASSSQNVSVLGALGNSDSDSNTTISTEVETKITNETISNIINNSNAQQEVVISGSNNIIDSFDMSQTMSIVSENCLSALNSLSSFTELKNDAKQSSTATQTNFISDIVSSIFDGIASLGVLWVIIIVCCVGVGGWIIINGGPVAALFGKGSSAQPAVNTGQMQYQMPIQQKYNLGQMQYQMNPGQMQQLSPQQSLAQQYGQVR
jgi:hypothetical protein